MKKRISVVCGDKEYEKLMLQYIRKRWQDIFIVEDSGAQADIIITDEPDEIQRKIVFRLSTVESDNPAEVYRYQSAEGILQEVLLKSKEALLPEKDGRKTKCIVFYTPGGSAAQSLAAKEYTRRLGSMESAVYIYYGDFGATGEAELQQGTADLSTLCYQIYVEGVESITREKLLAARQKGEGYQYFGYFHNPIHVVQMRDEFILLIRQIVSAGLFDSIVIDLQQLPLRFEELLEITAELYSIVPGEEHLKAAYRVRRGLWQQYLEKLDVAPTNIMIKEREYCEAGSL